MANYYQASDLTYTIRKDKLVITLPGSYYDTSDVKSKIYQYVEKKTPLKSMIVAILLCNFIYDNIANGQEEVAIWYLSHNKGCIYDINVLLNNEVYKDICNKIPGLNCKILNPLTQHCWGRVKFNLDDQYWTKERKIALITLAKMKGIL